MIKRFYEDYFDDILNSIDDIKSFIKGMEFNDFQKDKKTINAVVRSMEIMGEAAKKIPKTIRDKYPAVPWKKMAGMRDKMIHEYSGIDLEIIWKVATEDISKLKPLIKDAAKSLKE